MKQYIMILFIALIFGCGAKPMRHRDQIFKIELGRSGAWSDPGAALSVDSNLVYNYYGRLDSNKKRMYYTGKVSYGFWDTIVQRLERSKFRTALVEDKSHAQDASEFELLVHTKSGRVGLLRTDSYAPDSVLNFMIWLNHSYNKVKLHHIADSIKFGTRVQLPPPTPKVDRVFFLPPPIK